MSVSVAGGGVTARVERRYGITCLVNLIPVVHDLGNSLSKSPKGSIFLSRLTV